MPFFGSMLKFLKGIFQRKQIKGSYLTWSVISQSFTKVKPLDDAVLCVKTSWISIALSNRLSH